jgi:transposase
MARFDLSDDEWTIIEPLLPKRGRGPERRDDRVIFPRKSGRLLGGF